MFHSCQEREVNTPDSRLRVRVDFGDHDQIGSAAIPSLEADAVNQARWVIAAPGRCRATPNALAGRPKSDNLVFGPELPLPNLLCRTSSDVHPRRFNIFTTLLRSRQQLQVSGLASDNACPRTYRHQIRFTNIPG